MLSKLPHKVNVLFFIVALICNLKIKSDPPIWVGFGDPYDYLAQSKLSLTDKNLYCPPANIGFNGRPFTVPLLYKIADSDPVRIITLQEFLNALSSFFLVAVLLLYINRNYLKYIAIVSIYLLMSWWNILGWSINLLSESICLSLTFAWIASFLLLYRKRTKWYLVLHLLITLLFSFSRDNCPYIIVLLYSTLVIGGWLWDKAYLKQYLVLLASGVIVFAAQSYTAKAGTRNRLPILNNIVVRIMPDKDYFLWFKNNGLPQSDKLVAEYSGTKCNDSKIYKLYNDSSYDDLNTWVCSRGTSTFIKFLATHPYHAFLLDQTAEERNRIFAYNLPGYTGDINGYSKISDFIFPFFGKGLLIFLIFLVILKFIKQKQYLLLFPVILTIVFALHALLAYDSDALEVERHLFITNIMMQFIGIISVIFILNPRSPMPVTGTQYVK